MPTSKVSSNPHTVTIRTLRERAQEFLRVADNLEAEGRLTGRTAMTVKPYIIKRGNGHRTVAKSKAATSAKAAA